VVVTRSHLCCLEELRAPENIQLQRRARFDGEQRAALNSHWQPKATFSSLEQMKGCEDSQRGSVHVKCDTDV